MSTSRKGSSVHPCVLAALQCLVACAALVSGTCDVFRCFNMTEGLTVANGTVHNATSNYSAIQPYYSCMARAGSVRAFQCRCSLKIRDCAIDEQGGNCTEAEMRPACTQMLLTQGLGCSPVLCSAAGMGGFTVIQALVGVALLLLSMYFM